MIVARPQSKIDQRPRIRHRLRLPAVIGLIAPQRVFASLVPGPRRFTRQVMLSNERLLDFLCALGIDFLLSPRRSLL
jgi:hypothetical protein